MKKFGKLILTIAIAVVMLLTSVVGVFGAEGKSGETVTVTMSFSDIRSLDGNFSFDDSKGILSNVSYGSNAGVQFGNGKAFMYSDSESGQYVEIYITATLNGNPGDEAYVYLNNINVSYAGSSSAESLGTKSGVFKIAGEVTPDNDEPKPTPVPDNGNSTNKKPSTSIDYTELDRQITIAEGLKPEGYTNESWDAMLSALAQARDARSSKSQSTVDAAAKALADAIAALVKVDYTKLQATIDEAQALAGSNALAKLWKQLYESVNNGTLLLTSTDQAAIDKAAEELTQLLNQIKELLGMEVEKEEVLEEVDAEPEGKYCNVGMHKVWPILFFVSLAGNLVLVYIFVLRKKQGQKDDTPIVDYDITDDDK